MVPQSATGRPFAERAKSPQCAMRIMIQPARTADGPADAAASGLRDGVEDLAIEQSLRRLE